MSSPNRNAPCHDHTDRSSRGKKAHKRGTRAEKLCCWILRLKGYKILATRYKTHQGEIDIVALRGVNLAFIEVKSRPDLAAASEAVSPQQQERLCRTAALFHAHNRGYSRCSMRFDIMLVVPWRWPVHIQNAFACRVRI